jgi:hypothetical protein
MSKELLDFYSDYLISSFNQTTATGLSQVLDGAISHDAITRFLSGKQLAQKDLWLFVKDTVRKIESDDGIIAIDDSIEEKPYTDENEIICYHYDHAKGCSVKGINFVTALYNSNNVSIPVNFQIVSKTEKIIDKKTGKEKLKSAKTKNEYYREMLSKCKQNRIIFRYVINDVWYSSAENMKFVKQEIQKDFVMPIKSNRKIALSKTDKLNGKYQVVSNLDVRTNTTMKVYIEGIDFPVLLIKQIFKNGDGSEGILYLITSDLTLDYELMTTIYKRRWKVEEYHKSLKQNASLEKSPTQTVLSQSNHFFASLIAYCKLEEMKMASNLNHFALKTKIYYKALESAFSELQLLHIQYASCQTA